MGAGISGLAAGWFLKRKFGNRVELQILEKSERAGGWIKTIREGDFLLEAGPRGFQSGGKGEATLELVRELGVEKELVRASEEAKKRYVVVGGKLELFGPGLLLKNGVVGAVLRDLCTRRGEKRG